MPEPVYTETMADLIGSLEDQQQRIAEVDVTKWFPIEENADGKPMPRLWRYREPGAIEIFQAQDLTKKVRIRHPDFPVALAATVAQLAVCHLSPDPGTMMRNGAEVPISPLDLYATLAIKRKGLLFAINDAWMAAFPEMADIAKAADEAKND
jgi:hypothetical protein